MFSKSLNRLKINIAALETDPLCALEDMVLYFNDWFAPYSSQIGMKFVPEIKSVWFAVRQYPSKTALCDVLIPAINHDLELMTGVPCVETPPIKSNALKRLKTAVDAINADRLSTLGDMVVYFAQWMVPYSNETAFKYIPAVKRIWLEVRSMKTKESLHSMLVNAVYHDSEWISGGCQTRIKKDIRTARRHSYCV